MSDTPRSNAAWREGVEYKGPFNGWEAIAYTMHSLSCELERENEKLRNDLRLCVEWLQTYASVNDLNMREIMRHIKALGK